MTNWTFAASDESWTAGDFAFDGASGSPAAGCLFQAGIGLGGSATATITGLSIPVTAGDPCSFRVRVAAESGSTGDISIILYLNGVQTIAQDFTVASFPYDSGWQTLSGVAPATDTITDVAIAASSGAGPFDVYLDTVYVAESAPTSQRRILGMDADQTNLYLSAIENGTLSLFIYTLATLALAGTPTFGSCGYTDPDTFTRGLWPVVKPGSDGLLFGRGRDGNDNQVLLSDNYGATFADVSDAGWAADKYCVALRPDPLAPDDLVACFADNDLYRSEDGATTWSKTGDSPVTLRAAARHTSAPAELLLAAQAADSLRFTQNFGVSFDDISDTIGTVNAIEVSL